MGRAFGFGAVILGLGGLAYVWAGARLALWWHMALSPPRRYHYYYFVPAPGRLPLLAIESLFCAILVAIGIVLIGLDRPAER